MDIVTNGTFFLSQKYVGWCTSSRGLISQSIYNPEADGVNNIVSGEVMDQS